MGADRNHTPEQIVNMPRQIGPLQAPAARTAIALSLNIFKAISLSYEITNASDAAIPYLARLFQKSRAHGRSSAVQAGCSPADQRSQVNSALSSASFRVAIGWPVDRRSTHDREAHR